MTLRRGQPASSRCRFSTCDERRDSSPRGGTLAVREERVVPRRGGEHAFGQAEHDDEVEVEPHPHADWSDEHALAHPTHPAQVRLELELEGPREHVEVHRSLHLAQAGEPVEGAINSLGRPLLGRRPVGSGRLAAEELVHVPSRPRGPLRPRARRTRRFVQVVDEPQHELAQRAGASGVLVRPIGRPFGSVRIFLGLLRLCVEFGREPVEQRIPVVSAADDARVAGEALPGRGGDPAPAVVHAGSRQPGEHVVSPEPAVGKGQQPEQRPSRDARRQRHDRRAVDGQPGGRQLLVGQARRRAPAARRGPRCGRGGSRRALRPRSPAGPLVLPRRRRRRSPRGCARRPPSPAEPALSAARHPVRPAIRPTAPTPRPRPGRRRCRRPRRARSSRPAPATAPHRGA